MSALASCTAFCQPRLAPSQLPRSFQRVSARHSGVYSHQPFQHALNGSLGRGRQARSSNNHPCLAARAAGGRSESDPHLQLATAKIPGDVDVDGFISKLYQWASSLTSNGRNMPLALPLRTDRSGDGFVMQLLRVTDFGGTVSVGDIVVAVEPVKAVGNVLFVRFYEGIGAREIYKSDGDLDKLMAALVDVPMIVNTMPQAIKLAVIQSRG